MNPIFFPAMYNKTIIRFGFCDIQNDQGLGKGYQSQPSALADNPYFDCDYSGYHKTSSNNCLKFAMSYYNKTYGDRNPPPSLYPVGGGGGEVACTSEC